MPSVRIQSTCAATQLPIGATQTEWGPPPVCQATKSPPQNTQKTPDTQLFIGQSQYLQYADACSLSVVGAVTARRIVDFALLTFALLNVDLHV